MSKRAFRVAYDGRGFHGFQRQPDVPTVEDAVFDALRGLDALAGDADAPDGYAAAGRTDAGASAVAQTVAFECPDWCRPRALNSELPASVRAWAAADAPVGFHATHDARSREYTYHLHAPEADRGCRSVDEPTEDHGCRSVDEPTDYDSRARDALDALSGRHDFHNLTPDDEGTVRDIDADLRRDGDYLVVTLRADGFPRQLVRRVVSLARAVATGDAPPSKVERALSPEPLDGPEGVPPAPAYPLVLTDVEYDLDFDVDDEAAASARDVFADRRAEWATRARVADELVSGVTNP
jgi:tRNA pseudouridine38-40 synthase